MTSSPSAPKRVLLVDDEPNTLEVLLAGLRPLGQKYTFEAVNNAWAALDLLEKEHYDLIITDYLMPGMNGLELLQQVQKMSPTTEVVIMTAYGSEMLDKALEDLEVKGYLNKPFSLAQIRETVERVVAQTIDTDAETDEATAVGKPIRELIHKLRLDTNARSALLLSSSGYPLQISGQDSSLDMASISALVAANFMAANELARLLGNNSVFKSSYHEGPDYDIYAHDVDGDCLVAVIFDTTSKAGMVRYCTGQTITALTPLLAQNKNAPSRPRPDGFAASVNRDLQTMFDDT